MNWGEVSDSAPELAPKVQRRFEAHGLAMLATIRRDGAPRISGIETLFGAGELWLGMMPGSLKARDLLRDARLALHSATVDKDVKEGDAKISGAALPVEDEDIYRRYVEVSGSDPATALGSFHLFRVDIKHVSHLIPAGDHLDIEWWTEAAGYRRTERR